MKRSVALFLLLWAAAFTCKAASGPKVHVITFGKWSTVQWLPDAGDEKPVPMKVRALIVDGRTKEYTTGGIHEITERVLVVRRAFRVNDSLPDEAGGAPRWQWQRGGWLAVDRSTGHVSGVNLPEFDASYSAVSWYRDYAAYCGVSEDGKKIFAMVVQVSRRRPVLKKLLGGALADDAAPESACPAPSWQRGPARVTFESSSETRQTFAIRGHAADVVNDAEEEDEGSK